MQQQHHQWPPSLRQRRGTGTLSPEADFSKECFITHNGCHCIKKCLFLLSQPQCINLFPPPIKIPFPSLFFPIPSPRRKTPYIISLTQVTNRAKRKNGAGRWQPSLPGPSFWAPSPVQVCSRAFPSRGYVKYMSHPPPAHPSSLKRTNLEKRHPLLGLNIYKNQNRPGRESKSVT